jgi:hypothetical protein
VQSRIKSAIELLEDQFQVFVGDTHARIGYRNLYTVAFTRLCYREQMGGDINAPPRPAWI